MLNVHVFFLGLLHNHLFLFCQHRSSYLSSDCSRSEAVIAVFKFLLDSVKTNFKSKVTSVSAITTALFLRFYKEYYHCFFSLASFFSSVSPLSPSLLSLSLSLSLSSLSLSHSLSLSLSLSLSFGSNCTVGDLLVHRPCDCWSCVETVP